MLWLCCRHLIINLLAVLEQKMQGLSILEDICSCFTDLWISISICDMNMYLAGTFIEVENFMALGFDWAIGWYRAISLESSMWS